MWEGFKLQYLNGSESYKNEEEVYKHFINWIKKQDFNNGTNKSNSKNTSGKSPADERFEFYTNYASQFGDGSNESKED